LEKAIIDVTHTVLAKPSLELAMEGRKGFNVAVPFDTLIDAFAWDDGGFRRRRNASGKAGIGIIDTITAPWGKRFVVRSISVVVRSISSMSV
jgi:hypothetical protein